MSYSATSLPPRGRRRSPGTSEDVWLLAEAAGETQEEAGRLPEVVVEDADPEPNRAEAAAPPEAGKMTEAGQEAAQTTEDVLDALEAEQEHHLQAGQPYICLLTQCQFPVLSTQSQSCLTVK